MFSNQPTKLISKYMLSNKPSKSLGQDWARVKSELKCLKFVDFNIS